MWPQLGPGKFYARRWPEEDTLAPATPQKADTGRRRAGRPTHMARGGGKASAADSADEAAQPLTWRAQLQELDRTVNTELRAALLSAMLLLADQASNWHVNMAGLQTIYFQWACWMGLIRVVAYAALLLQHHCSTFAACRQAIEKGHILFPYSTSQFVLGER